MIYLYKNYSKKLHRGFFFGLCLTYIFVFRFFIEFLKENQEDFENNMMFNMGQWLSIPFVIVGIYFMFFLRPEEKSSLNLIYKNRLHTRKAFLQSLKGNAFYTYK